MTYTDDLSRRYELRANAPGFVLGSDAIARESGLCIVVFDPSGKYLTSRPVQRIDDYNAFEFCCRAIAAERFYDAQDAWTKAKEMKPTRCTCAPVPAKLPELFDKPRGF